ncbi:MAG: glycogen/starch synthase [Candidatus Symbiothrix sp.]|jgi:glycosyltransferase involved in cell wall biosynthesis|nr:glycogen/starch synthase [Candidatus Symbiothrix sp.]
MAKTPTVIPDHIFESSWEVCNKVGGIYTVLSTKAHTLQEHFPDKLVCIGPDLWKETTNPDFIESKTLLKAWRQQAFDQENLSVRVGRWNIPGKPIAVLVDFQSFFQSKDRIYFQMWEKYGINSSVGYGDYDEACLFAYAAAKTIESLYHYLKLENKNVIAHLHEWMLGMAVLYLHEYLPAVATVFTTHATSIGRSICGNDKPLYSQFEHYNGDQMAQELNMAGKHQLEKQAARWADCFTTVSEITGKECAQLLDKQPDIITPNGFEAGFVPEGEAFEQKRTTARKALIQVAERLTGTKIAGNALLVATSGRYEYRNKGLDVFIESLNRVKQAQPERAIVAFILVPAWIKDAREDLQQRLLQKKTVNTPLPKPFITHELMEPQSDKVCAYLQHLNFDNQTDQAVQIVFVPSYLKGNDGIFNLSYYDLLIGLDLTVFPSYYEPWGYTPLESIAFHIPTITTNLAGFGIWAKSKKAEQLADGVQVIERTDDNYFTVAEEIKQSILEYAQYDAKATAKTRKKAYDLSGKASWQQFIQYYLKGYEIALKKTERIKTKKS